MIEIVDASRVEATAVCVVEFGETEALMNHLRDSERFLLIYCGDELLGVFGAGRPTALSERAYVWFADTKAVRRHPVTFLRSVATIRDLLLASFHELVGLSFEARSVAWLEWLGAEFGPALPHGGRPFVFRRVHG